jgi:drug/metabolite transporter (DMT)-like permease
VISWLLLGETPSAVAMLGGAVCIGGVAIVRGARLPRPRLRRYDAAHRSTA